MNFAAKALEVKLRKWKSAYYNATPEVTDAEYDAELERLKGLDPDNHLFQEVGTETITRNKVTFTHKMLSLDKIKGEPEIIKWLINHPDSDYVISQKLDGCAIQVKYDKGCLVYVALRGDGEIGSNITNKIPYISGIPTNISHHKDLIITGEGVISWADFNQINEGGDFVNPRNLSNGALSPETEAIVCFERKVQFIAVNCWGSIPYEHSEYFNSRLDYLETLGFKVVDREILRDHGLITDLYFSCAEKKYDLDFPTDGLVISMNRISKWLELGSSNSAPRYMAAMKFIDDTMSVKITGIDWTISRNGVITPQAVFDPVFLGGANIGRASVHNYGRAKEFNLGIGDVIKICRSNEVIPYILEKVLNTGEGFQEPQHCPCEMKSEVENDGVRLYCLNPVCKFILAQSLDHQLKVLEFKGLGEKQLQALVESGVDSFYKFWTLEPLDFVDKLGWSQSHANEIWTQLDEIMLNVPFDRFIQCLGLKFAGRRMSKLLAEYFMDQIRMEELMSNVLLHEIIKKEIYTPLGFGPTQWSEFCNDYQKKGSKIVHQLLKAGFTIKSTQKTSGTSICITGKLSKSRDEYKKLIEDAGHEFTNSLTKSTTYLVTGSDGGGSKTAKAAKYGTQTKDEQWLIEFLKGAHNG